VVAVQQALLRMKEQSGAGPKALVCRTRKGHGVPDLEDAPLCHVMNPKPELLDRLLEQP
jgi:transketolase